MGFRTLKFVLPSKKILAGSQQDRYRVRNTYQPGKGLTCSQEAVLCFRPDWKYHLILGKWSFMKVKLNTIKITFFLFSYAKFAHVISYFEMRVEKNTKLKSIFYYYILLNNSKLNSKKCFDLLNTVIRSRWWVLIVLKLIII